MKICSKIQNGFIQIPILIAIIVVVSVVGGGVYIGVKKYIEKKKDSISDIQFQTPTETNVSQDNEIMQGNSTTAEESEVEKLKKEIEELKKQPPEIVIKEAPIPSPKPVEQPEEEPKEEPKEELKDRGDNDGDQLENWLEDEIGTDKNKADTDGDNVPDNLDEHPLDNSSIINKVYQVSDRDTGLKFSIRVNVPLDAYLMYKKKLRHDFEPNASNIVNYAIYTDPIIQDIVAQIEDIENATYYYLLRDLVNQIVYSDDIATGYDEYPKYPVETLVDGSGDCEDTSILFASLLTGYHYMWHRIYELIPNKNSPFDKFSVALLVFVKAGHVAVGHYAGPEAPTIPGGYHVNYEGGKYYYIETTSNDYLIGELPEALKGNDSGYIYVIDLP